MVFKIFKRCFDFTSALLLFLLISPLFAVLALMVRINLGKPIFFKQERTGMNYKPFCIRKFRTMTDELDEDGILLPDDKRMTKFGVWLRSTSLDELPELFNIIKGDMSVIGPRPLPPNYNDYYTEYERSRFKVRGGLIPPESLFFDSFVTWDNQLKYEADYANHLSLSLDVRLLQSVFKTIFKRTETDYGVYMRESLNVEREYMTKEVLKSQYGKN